MSSSNLALVFGPTLVHAPSDLDAIQLHNDVPAVNMLIQICIEQHHVIFAKMDSPPPPPMENEPRIVVTPPPPIAILEVGVAYDCYLRYILLFWVHYRYCVYIVCLLYFLEPFSGVMMRQL